MSFKIPADVAVPSAIALVASALAAALAVALAALTSKPAEGSYSRAGVVTPINARMERQAQAPELPAAALRVCRLALDANGMPQDLGRWH